MKKLSSYVAALKEGAQFDSRAPASGAKAGQMVLLPVFENVNVTSLGATSTSLTAYVGDNVSGSFAVAGVTVVFGTTSTSGTLQVEVATGSQAVGAGTNQLTGTVSLSGSANSPVNGTVIANPTAVGAGARINVILGGTLTGLANCSVNIVLQRVA